MTAPVSGIQNVQQPIAASNISPYQNIPVNAGYFVVNPPTIKPYSFYEEKLKKGDNYYDKAIITLASKKVPQNTLQKTKKKNLIKKIISLAVLVCAGIVAYKKRGAILEFFKKFKK